MLRFTHSMLLILTMVAVLLTGCQKATPTPDANQIYTQAAATVEAQLTADSALTPTVPATPTAPATYTPSAPIATDTPAMVTTVAPTLEATLTPAPPTNTPTATLAPNTNQDQAVLVGETPIDNQVIEPGKVFNKTWKLRNLGYTTWKTSYGLYFVSGDKMASKSPAMLTKEVKPMEDVEITIEMTAPTQDGKVRGNWVFRNDKGADIYPVFIIIVVGNPNQPSPTPTITPTP